MSKLKAFVGHSFTTDDESVVRAFIEYLNTIKDMNIGFTWESARSAEPKELATKVMSLMKGKNLFIGICTKKERVVEPKNVGRKFLGKHFVSEEHLLWKPSDWIIQEIGLAKGLGIDLLLLIEDGVRPPGGLQGDLEYISFNRATPEKSFRQILEMIHALMPNASSQATEVDEARSAPDERTEPELRVNIETSRTGWTRDDFEFALVRSVAMNDEKSTTDIYRGYLDTENGKSHENIESWEAFKEYATLVFGNAGDLTKLQGIAQRYSNNCRVMKYLAKAYMKYNEYEKAADSFHDAASKSTDEVFRLETYGDAAAAYARSSNKRKSEKVIQLMRDAALKVDDGETVLLETMRDIAEYQKDNDLYFELTEALLQLRPADNSVRFRLAYKYSEAGCHNLALFHYLRIPYQERHAGAWNNIGVEFEHAKLNSSSVKAYKKAEELGETLAMSNLAHRLIRAGFLEEAEIICNRAVAIKDYDKQIGNAISQMKDVPEEEKKKEDEIISETASIVEFYKDFGLSLIKGNIEDMTGVWIGAQSSFEIQIQNGNFYAKEISGRQTSQNPFRKSALAIVSGQTPRILYRGIVSGLTLKGIEIIENENPSFRAGVLSQLIGTSKPNELLMTVSDDYRCIKLYKKNAPENNRFDTLVREINV